MAFYYPGKSFWHKAANHFDKGQMLATYRSLPSRTSHNGATYHRSSYKAELKRVSALLRCVEMSFPVGDKLIFRKRQSFPSIRSYSADIHTLAARKDTCVTLLFRLHFCDFRLH